MKYLNVGCGKKYSEDGIWENIDMVSHSKHVREYNLLKGFPYPDNSFDAVYHSQVLEHIPKENAATFLKECFRVLKVGGILRVVVPDLENLMQEYQRLLKINLENPTKASRESYEWIMLEIYDQTVRNQGGGMMKTFLEKDDIADNQYVVDRMGNTGRKIQKVKDSKESSSSALKRVMGEVGFVKLVGKVIGMAKEKTLGLLLGNKYRIGSFRLGGEIHYWMYDKFSLGELLKEIGFKDIKVKSPETSDISNWQDYELDVKDNLAYDPTSLFMEAKK